MSINVVVIHVGQAGAQLGNSFWELLCIEHGVTPDGDCLITDADDNSVHAFYQEVNNGKFIPRVIFLDSEPIVIDEIRTGVYRQLYHPSQLISGKDDAANNFARGSFHLGSRHLMTFQSIFMKQMEQTDNPESILFFNGMGGGSGSGIGSLLLQQIMLDFPKLCKFQVPIHPSPLMSTAVVEPYNAVFHAHTTMEAVDLSMVFDNEALYEMCQKLLLIPSPTYNNINKLLSLVISSVTCSARFRGSFHIGLREIYTNLIPYPRIHYPLVNHSPIEQEENSRYTNMSLEQITKDVFTKSHQTMKCDLNRGKYMAIMLSYRGKISLNDASSIVQKYKNTNLNFVEWCPTGFKTTINHQCPTVVPDSLIAYSDKAVTMVVNSTAVGEIWLRLVRKFELLYDKRSFIHWYINEGMEEMEFGEAMIDMQLLSEDYDEIKMNEDELIDAVNKKTSKGSLSLSFRKDASLVENNL